MKHNQIHIFATKNDFISLLSAIESKQKLKFIKTGYFDTPNVQCVFTLLNDPNLGIALNGDNNHETDYMVADQSMLIEAKITPRRNGEIKYEIGDQRVNPNTIFFRPGGIFSGNCIIAGRAATISETKESLILFRLFNKEIKKQFKKIKSFFVGIEAEKLLDNGWRLTTSIKSPPLYDLQK